MIKKRVLNRLSEREWTLYRLHTESGILYSTLQAIKSGKTTHPDVATLRKLAAAFGDPLIEWLEAAGYLDGIEDVQSAIKARFAPLFDDEKAVELLYDPVVIEALKLLHETPEESRGKILETIKLLAKGMK